MKSNKDRRYGTTHKDRSVWFYERSAFPLRDAPPHELERFWAAQNFVDTDPHHQWEEAGPFNIAGRVTSLAVDSFDPNIVFAGSAGGGVWKSRDQGRNWKPSWGRFGNQNIGALTAKWFQDKLYVLAATGEANLSPDSYPGSGVYFSKNGGLTWQPYFFPATGQNRDADLEENVKTFPRRIGSVAFNGNGRIALASVTQAERMPAGLFLDEGATGLQLCTFWGNRSYNCHSVVFHPEKPDVIYVAIQPRGARNGIWRTRDGGKTWEQMRRGLPPGEEFGRTTLALAPSDPDVIYALASDVRKRVLGVFRSTDGGDNWKEILGNRFPGERFMSYNSTIVVHPGKPDFVIWGGARLYRTRNGGVSWQTITSGARGTSKYVHSDHHALVMPQGNLVFSGNDGGVAVSEDGGDTWEERVRGMVTTQFYDLDVAPSNGKIFGGGTQDNGTLLTGIGGKKGDFDNVLPGDGAWLVFDPADSHHVFGSAQEFFIYRHRRRGNAWTRDTWDFLPPHRMLDAERKQRAIAVLAIEPSTRKGVKKIWAGSHRLWRTDFDGLHWKPVSGSFDGSVISTIDISSVDPGLMFVGTTKGGIFRSTDGGETWTGDLAGIEVPRRMITRIDTHPRQRNTVVISVGTTGMVARAESDAHKYGPPVISVEAGYLKIPPSPLQNRDALPVDRGYSHIFRSSDLGETWTDIDCAQLPNVVYNAVVYETRAPYRLFAGGDAGVFVWQDGQWINISGNIPNVVVSDLVYHDKDRTLTASTYGRGIWRLPVRRGKFSPPVQPTAADVVTMEGVRVDSRVAAPVPLTPKDGAEFSVFPRATVVRWKSVPNAVGYAVEVHAMHGGSNFSTCIHTTETTELTFEFAGAQPGRWSVCAILPDSTRSLMSPLRTFRHLV